MSGKMSQNSGNINQISGKVSQISGKMSQDFQAKVAKILLCKNVLFDYENA